MRRPYTLDDALSRRILILDGGFGTMLQQYDLGDAVTASPEAAGGCNDLLSVTRPDIVSDIHTRYLEAGADIIETNSFNANAISLADYNLSDRAYEIARAAAVVARAAADRYTTDHQPRFVAGSMGPTNRTLSMSADVSNPGARDVTFGQMYDAYLPQARGLIDGGADLIMIETVFDTLNAKAAIAAVRDIDSDIPIILSATISDASGRTLTGQTVEAFCASVSHAGATAMGLNCGFGADSLLPFLRRLSRRSPVAVSVHPNAGLPNIDGGYDETPAMFADSVEQYAKEGLVNIIGGCCGTTPEHIAALVPIARKYNARPIPEHEYQCTVSGLEPLTINAQTGFVNIGERTNVAGSAKFARLIRENNYDEALEIAKAQVEAGAQVVDVCMDAALIDGADAMRRFINLMASEPVVARVPVMIDSSDFDVIEAGLQCAQGKSIVNSISLKEGETKFIERARRIMRYGAAVVVMLFDERGQADTYDRKIEVAERAYRLLTGIGFNAGDIIFDPNILAVATGMAEHDRYGRDFIDATRWIKENLPGAKVSGGVSNLSFAFRGNNTVRKAMHSVFLYHAIKAGMDMAIVNPQMVQIYDDIEPELLTRIEDVVLYRREDAADRLIEYAQQTVAAEQSDKVASPTDDTSALTTDERIMRAMLTGDTKTVADDTLQAYRDRGDAVSVINDVLMPAMARVGQMFADGRLFLPQVVKSARVMKLAVAAVEPYIGATGTAAGNRRKVVIATVKGDVHDIGKNIVGVVLACNGFDVIDLGVMVEPERIIDEALACGAAVICLSGLITPSLTEMANVAAEAQRRRLKIPIVVGGATTSDLHTAVKIAPLYDAPVAHARDAADNASIVARLTSDDAEAYISRLRRTQEEMRRAHTAPASVPTPAPAPTAVNPCPCCSCDSAKYMVTRTIAEVSGLINWHFFFASWGLPGTYPAIFDNPDKGAEARHLYDDARDMLGRLQSAGALRLKGVVRKFAARVEGDDIVIDCGGHTHRLAMLRNAAGESVCDFVDGEVTLFALSGGFGLEGIVERCRAEGDEYSALMAKLLADRLTEAFAESVLPGGCRIAVGYPSAPDHSLKRDILGLLDAANLTGMSLTESCMIVPGEAVCGIWLERGSFIDARPQDRDTLADYARRRGLSLADAERFTGAQ